MLTRPPARCILAVARTLLSAQASRPVREQPGGLLASTPRERLRSGGMAILKLEPPRWKYDTVTRELIMVFIEQAPDTEGDPASYTPDRKAEIRFVVDPANVTVTQL